MARAKSIYVVIDPTPMLHLQHVIAAFTVKHELITWLRKNRHWTYLITKTGDGIRQSRVTDVTEEIINECMRGKS
jgi:hypothetical protein